uniref:Uncharacterized protein n=1 Tax=Kryptolebias marmoratus TaxID=37003 RepID=A0A3Q3ASJ8_KRYMA
DLKGGPLMQTLWGLLRSVHPAHLLFSSHAPRPRQTYKFEHVPVKDVIIGETLSVEQIPEKLPWRRNKKNSNKKLMHEQTRHRLALSVSKTLRLFCVTNCREQRAKRVHQRKATFIRHWFTQH